MIFITSSKINPWVWQGLHQNLFEAEEKNAEGFAKEMCSS